jgi:hypothetical protein
MRRRRNLYLNEFGSILYSHEDPLIQDYKYSGIEVKIAPPQ